MTIPKEDKYCLHVENSDKEIIIRDSCVPWFRLRAQLIKFPGLECTPEYWKLDKETWAKITSMCPHISVESVAHCLMDAGYYSLSGLTLNKVWGFDCDPKVIYRAMFGREDNGDVQTYKHKGKVLPMVRIRQPNALITKAKYKGVKASKYLSPKGSGSHIFWGYNVSNYAPKYLPTVENVFGFEDDENLGYQARGHWFLTEGEDKAIVATLHGYPTIALQGVSMWGQDGIVHPKLWLFSMLVGSLTVVFDADIYHNSRVESALRSLGASHAKICKGFYEDFDFDWEDTNEDTERLFDLHKKAYLPKEGYSNLKYTYLPDNPFYKGIDDILAVGPHPWLKGLLKHSLPYYEIKKEKDKKGEWAVHSLWDAPDTLGSSLGPKLGENWRMALACLCSGGAALNHVALSLDRLYYKWDKNKKCHTILDLNKEELSVTLFNSQFSRPMTSGIFSYIPKTVWANMESTTKNYGEIIYKEEKYRIFGTKTNDIFINGKVTKLEIDPQHAVINRLPFDFSDDDPEIWFEFFERIGWSKNKVNLLRAFVYLSVAHPDARPIVGHFIGLSGKGKSLLIKIIETVLGSLVRKFSINSTLQSYNALRGSLPPKLIGAAICIDGDFKGHLDAETIDKINNWADNEKLSYRSMGKDPIDVTPNSSLLMVTNHELVMNSDDTTGLARRFIKWDFKGRGISPKEYDYFLGNIKKKECGAIANWFLSMDFDEAVRIVENFTEENETKIKAELKNGDAADWLDNFVEWVKEMSTLAPEDQSISVNCGPIATYFGDEDATGYPKFTTEANQADTEGEILCLAPGMSTWLKKDGVLTIKATPKEWVEAYRSWVVYHDEAKGTKRGRKVVEHLIQEWESSTSLDVQFNSKCWFKLNNRSTRGWSLSVAV